MVHLYFVAVKDLTGISVAFSEYEQVGSVFLDYEGPKIMVGISEMIALLFEGREAKVLDL
jgi:hypothetical protein